MRVIYVLMVVALLGCTSDNGEITGLLRSCPAKLLRFKGRVEEFNAFGEYVYCLLDNTKFIQIIKFK